VPVKNHHLKIKNDMAKGAYSDSEIGGFTLVQDVVGFVQNNFYFFGPSIGGGLAHRHAAHYKIVGGCAAARQVVVKFRRGQPPI